MGNWVNWLLVIAGVLAAAAELTLGTGIAQPIAMCESTAASVLK